MSTLKRGFLALAIAPVLLGATVNGSTFAARPHQHIGLAATLSGHTLTIKGTGFQPGVAVRIAVVDTRSWKTLAGVARAEGSIYACPTGASQFCGQRDPNAGNLYFTTSVRQNVHANALVILYRAGSQTGFGRVQAL